MTQESTLSPVEQLKLIVKTSDSLEAAHESIKATWKIDDLKAMAEELGVESPASTKDPLIEQVIAKAMTGEDANIGTGGDDTSAGSPSADQADDADSPNRSASSAEPESADSGELPSESEGSQGVRLPAKVASYQATQLWPQILGWELNQGLDEDARALYTEDELREYLAYLFYQRDAGRPIPSCLRISEYTFVGVQAEDA